MCVCVFEILFPVSKLQSLSVFLSVSLTVFLFGLICVLYACRCYGENKKTCLRIMHTVVNKVQISFLSLFLIHVNIIWICVVSCIIWIYVIECVQIGSCLPCIMHH